MSLQKHVVWSALALLCGATLAGVPRTVLAQDSTTASKPATKTEPAKRGNRYLITEGEIATSSQDNAFDVIETIRPSMLMKSRGLSSDADAAVEIMVYLDEVRLGNPENLRNIPRTTVREIRFISASEATMKFGTGHGAGAILVSTKR